MRASSAKNLDHGADAAQASARSQFKSDIEELRSRLTAVMSATSEAATTIISGLEHVIAFGEQGDTQNRAFDALSACVFHDIVGQHVARAAELLEIIERLGAAQEGDEAVAAAQATVRRRSGRMVNGPALDGESGLDQTDVDYFFK